MVNKYIIFILMALCLMIPASAFSNGGFETGSLSPWTETIPGIISPQPVVAVSTTAKLTGNYGLSLFGNITFPAQTYPAVGQRISINFTSVELHYKINESAFSGTPNFNVYSYIVTEDTNEWIEVFDIDNPPEGGWVTVRLNRSDVPGGIDWGTCSTAWLMIESGTSMMGAGSGSFGVYFDDVSITAPGDTPITCTNVSGVTSNSAILCAVSGAYPMWFKYGQLPGHLSWQTPNITSGTTYNVHGSPLLGNTVFYYSACDESGCGEEQVFRTLSLTPQVQTTFSQSLNNITSDPSNIAGIASESVSGYFWLLNPAIPTSYSIVWGLVFLAIFLGLWIRERDLTVPVILGLITGTFIMYSNAGLNLGIPVYFQSMAQGIAYASLAGVILAFVKRS